VFEDGKTGNFDGKVFKKREKNGGEGKEWENWVYLVFL